MSSTYHERRLPHWQPEGADLFVTWRLHGCLPADRPILIGSTAGKVFVAMDRELAKASIGPKWLADRRVAQVVADTLLYGEQQLHLYDLHAWVIMPDHVHILIQPHADLSQIMKTIKGFSARQANEILGRSGEAFWQKESYDHWVRDELEFHKIVCYIESNPVSPGLVEDPEDWAFSSSGRAGLEARATSDVQVEG
jgi:putative transposase